MVNAGAFDEEVISRGGFLPENSRDCPAAGLPPRRSTLFGDAMIVVFLAVQILDGAFTYLGIRIFGPSIEANPLLAWLITVLGPVGALASAKGAAIVAGAFLHLSDVHRVVATLSGLYLLLAIGPWTHLLFFF
jgi:hypothetical protein